MQISLNIFYSIANYAHPLYNYRKGAAEDFRWSKKLKEVFL